jgi:transcriptional/translational regulatory protein YebC/TACO1
MELNEFTHDELVAELRRRQLDAPKTTLAILQDRTVHLTEQEADEIMELLDDLENVTDDLLYEHWSKDGLDQRLQHIRDVASYLDQ